MLALLPSYILLWAYYYYEACFPFLGGPDHTGSDGYNLCNGSNGKFADPAESLLCFTIVILQLLSLNSHK